MLPYQVLFFGILYFILGVLVAGLKWKLWMVLGSSFVVSSAIFFLYLLRGKKYACLFPLSVFMLIGFLYNLSFGGDLNHGSVDYDTTKRYDLRMVEKPSLSGGTASVKAETAEGDAILVKVPRFPEVGYGDSMVVEGIVKKIPGDPYGSRLAGENVVGIMSFPEIKRVMQNPPDYKEYLFHLKDDMTKIFRENLPQREGAFLSGLMLGERGYFSADFENSMRKSGTTHLVALSGYNVSLVVIGVMFLFSFVFPRLWSFILTSVAVFLFVVMTGAEASVVRAAIMGFLILAARENGRFFDIRNVIMLAALSMILINPGILISDIGFQLSFLAFVGIAYLAPAIGNGVEDRRGKSFLNWKDSLISTVSAQVMVLPVLLNCFGSFSPLGLASNTLILGLVPITMGLGFAVAFLGLIWGPLSLVASWIAYPFLRFETAVIDFFGHSDSSVSLGLSWPSIAVYYSAVLLFVVWRKKLSRKY